MKQVILSTPQRSQSDGQKEQAPWLRSFVLFALLLLATLLAACQPIRPVASTVSDVAPSSEAVAIVQRYYAALNAAVADAQQIDEAMSLIAADAVFINPTGSYKTTEEIRASLVGGAADGLTFDLSNFRDTNGRVVYDYKVKIGDEILDTGTDGLTIVKGGLIIFDGTERTEP